MGQSQIGQKSHLTQRTMGTRAELFSNSPMGYLQNLNPALVMQSIGMRYGPWFR